MLPARLFLAAPAQGAPKPVMGALRQGSDWSAPRSEALVPDQDGNAPDGFLQEATQRMTVHWPQAQNEIQNTSFTDEHARGSVCLNLGRRATRRSPVAQRLVEP